MPPLDHTHPYWANAELKRELVERGVVPSALHPSIHHMGRLALIKKVKTAVAETPDLDPDDRIFEYMIAEQAAARHRTSWENARIIKRAHILVRSSECSEITKTL